MGRTRISNVRSGGFPEKGMLWLECFVLCGTMEERQICGVNFDACSVSSCMDTVVVLWVASGFCFVWSGE